MNASADLTEQINQETHRTTGNRNTQSTSGWHTHHRSLCQAFVRWNSTCGDFSVLPCSACRTLPPSPAAILVRVFKEVGFGPEVMYDLASSLPTQPLPRHGSLHASIAKQSGGACRPCVYRTHRACSWGRQGSLGLVPRGHCERLTGTDGHFLREARLPAGREKNMLMGRLPILTCHRHIWPTLRLTKKSGSQYGPYWLTPFHAYCFRAHL